jgi:hypothetical protein
MSPLLGRLVFVTVASLPAIVLAEQTLCSPGETVYFSCKVEGAGELVSLCGNSFENPERFWLQYRFGRPEKLALVYPKDRSHFLRSSFDVSYFRRPKGFDTEVSFTNGGWSYTVFHWAPGETESGYETTYKSGVAFAQNRAGHGTTFNCAKEPNLGQDGAFSILGQRYGKE